MVLTDSFDGAINATVFQRNTAAERGGAILVQQRSNVVLTDVVLVDNVARTGGAVVVALESNVVTQHSSLLGNAASVGAAVFVDGSDSRATAVFDGCFAHQNQASLTGGELVRLVSTPACNHAALWCYAGFLSSAASNISIRETVVQYNTAEKGGSLFADTGTIISVQSSICRRNSAVVAGGCLLVQGLSQLGGAQLTWTRLAVVGNKAVSGGGVFFQLRLPHPQAVELPTASCGNCSFVENHNEDVGTSPTGMWVSDPLAFGIPNGMPLATYSNTTTTPRPHAYIVDALSQPVSMDNVTSCDVSVQATTGSRALVTPSLLQAQRGQLDIGSLQLLSSSNATTAVRFRCVLTSPLQGTTTVWSTVTVSTINCLAAWDQTSVGPCRMCAPQTYSHDGQSCLPCPTAANCSQQHTDSGVGDSAIAATMVGVARPVEMPGFWLGQARRSIQQSAACAQLQLRRFASGTTAEGNPQCAFGLYARQGSSGDVECEPVRDVDAEVLFACGMGLELYKCPVPEACRGGASFAHSAQSVSELPTWAGRHLLRDNPDPDGTSPTASTCREGHIGPMCAECEQGFVMDKSQLCAPCPDHNMWLYAVGAAITVGGLLLGIHVYGGNPIPVEALRRTTMAKCVCRSRTAAKPRHSLGPKLRPKRPPWSAYISCLTKAAMAQPDKYMMILSFVQICSQFKSTYQLEWPVSLLSLMKVRFYVCSVDCAS